MLAQLLAASPDALAYPLVGLIVGLAIGLTGMGGGVLLTPIMVLFLGVPPNVAIANDLLISLAVKPVGALAHGRAGTVRRDLVMRLAAGSIPAAFLGAVLVNTWFSNSPGLLKNLIGGTLLVATAMMVIRLFSRTQQSDDVPPARMVPTVAIGAVGGLLVGMTSVGSGSLMLVLLSFLYPTLASRTLVGTDIAQAIPLVAAASFGHLLFGEIHVAIVLPVLLGALPGVWLGSRWSVRMPDRALRPTLLVLVGASGLKLVGVI